MLLQISVYDTINRAGNYTQKVRRLGEFHPILKDQAEPDGQDIDDPLYGNEGGQLEAVRLGRIRQCNASGSLTCLRAAAVSNAPLHSPCPFTKALSPSHARSPIESRAASEHSVGEIFRARYSQVRTRLLVMQEAVRVTADLIYESCEGLLDFLQQLREAEPGAPLAPLLRTATAGMRELDWLAPPMLTPR